LGSAAVFTVYSAGYFRTREAAERFAGESVQRRAAVAATPAPSAQHVDMHSVAPADSSTKLPVMQLSSPAHAGSASGPRSVRAASPVAAHAPDSAAAQAASSEAATVAAAPAAPAAPPEPQPSAVAAAAPVAAQATPPAPAAPAAVDSAASPLANATGQLKDGTYYGWGTSRHGDIQASVEVKSGKIVGAYISQCLTRYSCSWISALPPQVLQRQSAEVDYVSGATQSSNAFYYAIAEALKKAK
jgi:uncharacterized protein with FMN-binding domain